MAGMDFKAAIWPSMVSLTELRGFNENLGTPKK